MFEEGYKISAKSYKDDTETQNLVRKNSQLIPHIRLHGEYENEKDNNELFEEIIRHCSKTTESLTFYCMDLNLPAENLKVFALLKKLVFESCTIENDSILRFNEWCPNITEIRFKEGVRMDDDTFLTFTSTDTDVICPQVKKFEFNFGDEDELTREFMAAMDHKFPALEDLRLGIKPSDDFSPESPECNVPYEPLYFKKLKKLFVSAFCEEVDRLFDFMAISNAKLKELTFYGMTAPDNLMEWIEGCKRLGKLTLDCPYLCESELNNLHEMKWLREVKLECKQFHWEPEEMLKFVRTQKGLKKLVISSDRKNNAMKYGKEFQKLFSDLVKERAKLAIHVEFCQGRREMEISAKGFSETQLYETPSTDDES